MDEHIIEALGKTKIKISNGEIIEIDEPNLEYCPLFHKHQNIEKITKEKIKENIEFRIKDFGMCTPKRVLKMKDFLNFGISETIQTLIKENKVDTAVMVCEGCGTVLLQDPEMVQGIGGRVSGLVKTSPIPEIIEQIGEENTLDPKNATINQSKGVELAIKKGYENIAVTLALAEDALKIKKLEKENPEVNIYKFSVHSSKLSKEDAKILHDECDVMTACASKNVRAICEEDSLFHVGEEVPIYALTEDGVEFLKLRLEKIGGQAPKKEDPKAPYPLF